MTRFFCWLLGHGYKGVGRFVVWEDWEMSVLTRQRDCLCCDGLSIQVTVRPEDYAGSRFIWNHAPGLIERETRLGRPLWCRR